MNKLVFKLKCALQRHGISGLVKAGVARICYLAKNLRPSVRATEKARAERCAMFDKEFGIETAGSIHHTDLNTNNPNQLFAGSYFGSDPEYVRDVIGTLPIDYQRFVFIDYGSGKGRVILLATEFPFKAIFGVEFSEALHKTARDNIRRFPLRTAKCQNVESICMDAVNYSLPMECLVLYLFNPFNKIIMTMVLQNIEKSLLEHPREIFIVYANPVEGDLFDQSDCFKLMGSRGPVSIWKTTPEAQGCKG